MKTETARELLELTGDYVLTTTLIDTAFRARIMATHPDQNGGQVPFVTPQQLKDARETLRQVVTGANNACKTCKGAGKVRVRLGTVPCGACKGTGDKRGS